MRALILPLMLLAAPFAAHAETRCGWLTNPSAGNEYLIDADAVWTLRLMGEASPQGYDLLADIDTSEGIEGVETAPGYGYVCACLEVETGGDRITRVTAPGQMRPLAVCEADPALADKRPDPAG